MELHNNILKELSTSRLKGHLNLIKKVNYKWQFCCVESMLMWEAIWEGDFKMQNQKQNKKNEFWNGVWKTYIWNGTFTGESVGRVRGNHPERITEHRFKMLNKNPLKLRLVREQLTTKRTISQEEIYFGYFRTNVKITIFITKTKIITIL